MLASASPRRAELLTAAGIAADIHPAHIDESVRPGEGAVAYAVRLAEEKARVVCDQLPGRAVLAADTVVEVDGHILGKPLDDADARRMLGLLSGRRHRVVTGVSLALGETQPDGRVTLAVETGVEVTEVEFAALSAGEIEWYTRTGEPFDKAGAYAIQGYASRFVNRIEGSYSNVVGLPVARVYQMCTRAGILLS